MGVVYISQPSARAIRAAVFSSNTVQCFPAPRRVYDAERAALSANKICPYIFDVYLKVITAIYLPMFSPFMLDNISP